MPVALLYTVFPVAVPPLPDRRNTPVVLPYTRESRSVLTPSSSTPVPLRQLRTSWITPPKLALPLNPVSLSCASSAKCSPAPPNSDPVPFPSAPLSAHRPRRPPPPSGRQTPRPSSRARSAPTQPLAAPTPR